MNLLDYVQAPCILNSGYVALTPTQTGVADSGKLQNNYRAPMLLTEIRFTLQMTGLSNFTSIPFDMRGYVRARIRMGSIILTDQHVPLFLLGSATPSGLSPVVNIGLGTPLDGAQADEVTLPDGGAILSEYNDAWNYVVWKFRRPMYVPANAGFNVDFIMSAGPDSAPAACSVDTTLQGFYLKNPPYQPESIVPYAAGWNSSIDLAYAVRLLMSPQNRFKNPFCSPMRVNQFIGRLQSTPVNGSSSTQEQTNYTDGLKEIYPVSGSNNLSAPAIKLFMGEHQAIRDLTPWWVVFDPQTFSWDVDFSLKPNEYIDFWTQGNTWVGILADRKEKI